MTLIIPPRVFVAVPAYGEHMSTRTVNALLGLQRSLLAHDCSGGYGSLSFPDIGEIRNIFLTVWYDKVQTSHLLFIDSDMGFDAQLVIDMLSIDKPLVGALCPKRKLPIEFAGRALKGDARIINNAFMEVDGIGAAVMLIRRDAVDAVLGRYPELIDEVSWKNHAAKGMLDSYGVTRLIRGFDPLYVDGEKFSEDLSFCRRYRDTGGEIWANISHQITHVGMYDYGGRYLDVIKDQIKPVGAPAAAPPVPAQSRPVEIEGMALPEYAVAAE